MNQKTTLAIAVAIVGGVTIAVANPWNPKMQPTPVFASQKSKKTNRNSQADMETRTSRLNMDATGIKHIKVDIELGEVEVSTNSSSKFEANITKGISRPIGEEERNWLDNPWLKVRRDGDTLVVYEDKSLKPDFNRRNNSKNGNNRIDFTIKIQIPTGLNADLKLLAGNEVLSGEYKSLKTHISAGDLNLDQVDSGDYLNVDMDAGEVNAKLSRVPTSASRINVSVGEINLDLNGNATIFAKSGIGSISPSGKSDEEQEGLGSKQQIKVGSGGTSFTLEVGAGSINVGKGMVEKRSKKDNESDEEVESDQEIDFRIDAQDKADLQREISEAMREAKRELNSVNIQKEVENALKEARIEMKSIDIDKEISRAMKESQVDVASALKDADREIAKAMREVEIEMAAAEDAEGRNHFLSRDALKIARQILDQTRATLKKSMSNVKASPRKPATKKTSHD